MNAIARGMAYAQKSAEESDYPNFRVGAALMKGKRLIASGRNWFKKTHPKSKTIWNGIHAEFNCLCGLDPNRVKGYVIFVVRITNSGALSMARPCDYCMDLLREYGIHAFYYTDFSGILRMETI